jgi:hypothetical protein
VTRPFRFDTHDIEPVPPAHRQAVADALLMLLTDVTAAEAFGALEEGPDTLGHGTVLLVYEVSREQRVVKVLRYLWLG